MPWVPLWSQQWVTGLTGVLGTGGASGVEAAGCLKAIPRIGRIRSARIARGSRFMTRPLDSSGAGKLITSYRHQAMPLLITISLNRGFFIHYPDFFAKRPRAKTPRRKDSFA